MNRTLCALALAAAAFAAPAKEAAPAAADPALEARMQAITAQLRCLVCQNQTVADSHAELAEDLRQVVREQLRQGRTDREIVDYMTARYGDFILYRPPLKPTTAPLWFAPGLLLVGGAIGLVLVLRRRARMGDECFEPEEGTPDEAASAAVADGQAAPAPAPVADAAADTTQGGRA